MVSFLAAFGLRDGILALRRDSWHVTVRPSAFSHCPSVAVRETPPSQAPELKSRQFSREKPNKKRGATKAAGCALF